MWRIFTPGTAWCFPERQGLATSGLWNKLVCGGSVPALPLWLPSGEPWGQDIATEPILSGFPTVRGCCIFSCGEHWWWDCNGPRSCHKWPSVYFLFPCLFMVWSVFFFFFPSQNSTQTPNLTSLNHTLWPPIYFDIWQEWFCNMFIKS